MKSSELPLLTQKQAPLGKEGLKEGLVEVRKFIY